MARLVAIDDGHGMNTAGKRTPVFPDGTKSPETGKNFMHENEFNRAVANYLKRNLERCGFRTLMIAPTDADDSLATRVARADNSKADLYISIHANANTGSFGTWGGTETFTYKLTGESNRIGKIIHKHLMKGTPLRDRGVKDGSHLYVIKNTDMPAVLVECAFMDNLQEAKLLLSDDFRKESAREIAMGICEAYGVAYVNEAVAKPAQPTQPAQEMYRIRLNWTDAKTQKGAYTNLSSAKALVDSLINDGDYKVFDSKGNVVYDPTPIKEDNVWYRVRKEWADAKTQAGAFHDLNSAKAKADELFKDGYEVYDEKGNVIYKPSDKVEEPIVTPAPKPEPTPTPVVEQPKEEVESHEGHHDILGESTVSIGKMVAFVKSKYPDVQDIEEIAKSFIEVGNEYEIRGDIAFCQSILETKWFTFEGGTAVTPDQHNYCGHGVVQTGVKGNSFVTVREGVEAQIQHLYGYAVEEQLDQSVIVDTRYKYLVSGNKLGTAPHWEDLNMKWAMNDTYGQHILSLYQNMIDFEYVEPIVEIVEEDKQYSLWTRIIDYLFVKLSSFFGKK